MPLFKTSYTLRLKEHLFKSSKLVLGSDPLKHVDHFQLEYFLLSQGDTIFMLKKISCHNPECVYGVDGDEDFIISVQ